MYTVTHDTPSFVHLTILAVLLVIATEDVKMVVQEVGEKETSGSTLAIPVYRITPVVMCLIDMLSLQGCVGRNWDIPISKSTWHKMIFLSLSSYAHATLDSSESLESKA